MTKTGVLRKRDRRRKRRGLTQLRVPRRARSAFDTAVTAIGIVLHVALALLRRRDNHFLDDGDAKMRVTVTRSPAALARHDAPARTRPILRRSRSRLQEGLETRSLRRRRCRATLDDTPDRHARGGQRRAGLVGDRPRKLSPRLRPAEAGQHNSASPRRSPDRCVTAIEVSFLWIGCPNIVVATTRINSGGERWVVVALLELGAASSEAQAQARQVLMLQSFDRGIQSARLPDRQSSG